LKAENGIEIQIVPGVSSCIMLARNGLRDFSVKSPDSSDMDHAE
jgi:precorrin-4 methylase